MKRLKELREQKSLTQQQVANELHISRQLYGLYERGQRQPDIETIIMIASFFQVSTDYLLGVDSIPQNTLQDKIKSADDETLQELEEYLDYINYKKQQDNQNRHVIPYQQQRHRQS